MAELVVYYIVHVYLMKWPVQYHMNIPPKVIDY